MLFNSYIFLLGFLPISIVGYYILGRTRTPTAAKCWLAIASFIFYGWWNAGYVVLLLVSIAVNFYLGMVIVDSAEKPILQRWMLATGVALNLSALVYYKYLFVVLNFFHAHNWISDEFSLVILPLGISFFTFTQIGFLVDCQQGMVQDKNLLDYTLFVTFFPHLIAGPILHHREIMPQFADNATFQFDSRKVAAGLTLFAFGLIKKVLFADSIAPWVESNFGHPGHLGMAVAWSTIVGYSMQLYFDFSGYSDMAVGLGAMFGVRLPLNFNSPYKSASIIEFWQRWHMTLTRYLTLLVYNPISLWITRRRMRNGLSINRKAQRTVEGFYSLVALPTVTTMFLAGIWHGAGLQFLVWGALHGFYLTTNHAWRIFGSKAKDAEHDAQRSTLSVLWRVVLTYASVLLAQVFFRSASVADALSMLAGAVGMHGYDFPLPVAAYRLNRLGIVGNFLYSHGVIILTSTHVLWDAVTKPLMVNCALIVALCLIVWAAPNSVQILDSFSPALQKVEQTKWRLLRWRPNLNWAGGIGAILFFVLTRLGTPGRFLYFQF